MCCDNLYSSLSLLSLSSKHFSHLNGSCLEVRLFAFQKNLIDVPEVKDARFNGIDLIMQVNKNSHSSPNFLITYTAQ